MPTKIPAKRRKKGKYRHNPELYETPSKKKSLKQKKGRRGKREGKMVEEVY